MEGVLACLMTVVSLCIVTARTAMRLFQAAIAAAEPRLCLESLSYKHNSRTILITQYTYHWCECHYATVVSCRSSFNYRE